MIITSIAELNARLKGTGITAKYIRGAIHYYARAMHKGKRLSATYYSLEEAQNAILQFKLGFRLPEPEFIPDRQLEPVTVELKLSGQEDAIRAGSKMMTRAEAFLILQDAPPHELSSLRPYKSVSESGEEIHVPATYVKEFLYMLANEPEAVTDIISRVEGMAKSTEYTRELEIENEQQAELGLREGEDLAYRKSDAQAEELAKLFGDSDLDKELEK